MNADTAVSPHQYRAWLLLILLAAISLRIHAIADAPPGLTHDEADHGITAWEIVNGARGVYFTIGYGREPLYDYATAVLMTLTGPTYLAARLTAVFFSLILIAGTAAWVRRAFDAPTALLAAAGLAVGFWPVMAARQALRSIALPALFVLAVFFWWRGAERLMIEDSGLKARLQWSIINFLFTGFFLGASFYTYIPARVMWGIFPALLLFAAWRQRLFLRRAWWGTGLMLLVAAAVAAPLFYYLYTHPEVEVRIQELSAPLRAVTEGNFEPFFDNALASLHLFTIEGDMTWRYNIPGRPFFQPVMGGLFYLGVGVAVWQVFRGNGRTARASFLALAWLLAGFSPVLVTGPDLSMTQAMGIQPVVYLFPALALTTIGKFIPNRSAREQGSRGDRSPVHLFARLPIHLILALLLFGATAAATARDYFVTWANAPEVRVQYESTMMAAMAYLNQTGDGPTAVSTITPGHYHSPALARMTLRNPAVSLRWFDGQHSLLLPAAAHSTVIIPGFTPLPPALSGYFATAILTDTLPLRSTDQDRPLAVYRVDGPVMQADWLGQFHTEQGGVDFGGAVEFLGYDLAATAVRPGRQVQVATLWRVKRPLNGAVLFTHLIGPEGTPIAQADRLDVPGESWQPGDWFIQLHTFTVPVETAVGKYPLTAGVYTCPGGLPCPNGQRLAASTGTDTLLLTTVNVIP